MSINVIPAPNAVDLRSGTFNLATPMTVVAPDVLENESACLCGYLNSIGCQVISVRVKPHDATDQIHLKIVSDSRLGSEGYVLQVDAHLITIRANQAAGIFYGIQTLRQLAGLSFEMSSDRTITCLEIIDEPRFPWRGFMLDESRHFFGKDHVKKLLDWMGLVKLNRFHWHLTDMPAWRIEIISYPKLTTVGAVGTCSDPTTPAQFYTQDDIREIISYAQQRHIVIVPEIDMPGHATAANRAYPTYSGGGSERFPEFTFNPGNEETYIYLETILKEVADLFPGPWIHFGGDEVHFGNEQWNSNPDIQALMKAKGLADLKAVECYFTERIGRYISSLGKKPMGWDEIVGSGISPETTALWWRHNLPEVLTESYAKGFSTILCPRIPCYFDFVQHDSHEWGRRWAEDGFGTIEQLFHYPSEEHLPEDGNLLLGVQGCLWTEMVGNAERADFLTFPRIFALASAGWTWDGHNRVAQCVVPVLGQTEIYLRNHCGGSLYRSQKMGARTIPRQTRHGNEWITVFPE